MNVDHPTKLTHVSLCTGYGGIDLGLSRALSGAVRNVAYVEIEAFATSNLVSKIENGHLDTAPIYTDLKRFPWRRFRGRVDILSGGFPCQPFSSAGARRGDDDPRHLFPYILQGLRELGRPPLVFLENVEGIISSKLKGDGWSDPEGTPVLLHVIRELERVGYNATAGVFSAREIGAPHQRKRVFILGCRADLGESGRAIVSRLLDRGRDSSVGNSESGDGSSPLWGREPELRRVQLSPRESGTGYPAPRGADMEHAPSSRLQGSAGQSVQGRGARPTRTGTAYPAPRGADVEHSPNSRSQGCRPTKRGARVLSESAESGTAYPAPRGADVEDTDSRQRPWLPEHRPPKNTEPTQSRERDLTRAPSHTNDRTAYPAPRGADVEHTTRRQDTRRESRNPRGEGAPTWAKELRESTYTGPTAYPAPRGAEQHPWEPPRVTRETEPAMGGNADGAPGGMGYAELCRSVDNRTDELRLLGNGVVPDTAARAFRELWRDLNERG